MATGRKTGGDRLLMVFVQFFAWPTVIVISGALTYASMLLYSTLHGWLLAVAGAVAVSAVVGIEAILMQITCEWLDE